MHAGKCTANHLITRYHYLPKYVTIDSTKAGHLNQSQIYHKVLPKSTTNAVESYLVYFINHNERDLPYFDKNPELNHTNNYMKV